MVYGVTRIDLPSCDWGGPVRGPVRVSGTPLASAELASAGDTATLFSGGPRSGSTSIGGTFVAGPENRLAIPALRRLLDVDSLGSVDLGSVDPGSGDPGSGDPDNGDPDNGDPNGGDPNGGDPNGGNRANGNLSPATGRSRPLTLFNPLVLLGPTGIGKSHLALGITRHWQAQYGAAAVEYLTAIDFARQLRAAREEDQLESFRMRLADLQLLVIEDLQRLPSSRFVQRELRDTLDLLIESEAAVVVTAQRPPAAMAGLEAGLRDRLTGGLAVRLQPPGVEARLALLQLIAAARGVQVDTKRLSQLAEKVAGTVPQLMRALAELDLTATASQATLATRPPLKLKQIIGVVARYYSLTQAALCSPARRKSLVYARGIAIYLARSLTDLSYTQIGQSLGKRDHSTIMHAARTLEKRLLSDAGTQQDIEELNRILTAV